MSSTNLGNQIITFDYKEPTTSRDFNTFLRGAIKPGIYDGGLITHTSGNKCEVSILNAVLNVDSNSIVCAVTSGVKSITVTEATPVIYTFHTWTDTPNQNITLYQKAKSTSVTNEVIIAEANFVSGTITGFDYTDRTLGLIDQLRNVNVENILYLGSEKDASIEKSAADELTFNNNLIVENAVDFQSGVIVLNNGIFQSNLTFDNTIILNKTDNPPLIVNSTSLVSNLNVDKLEDADLDTDTSLYPNSDLKIPSQKAFKTYLNKRNLTIGGILLRNTQFHLVETNTWNSVCWSPELELFVAVASTGTNRVMYSSDGITWTLASAAEANSWISVCWSPELSIFVAVSPDGTNLAMYSADGVVWTAANISEANTWLSVCWSPELELFVAVGASGTDRVTYSNNGIDWTLTNASDANVWRSVCWSPELSIFVAVASAGTNRVMYSSDGVTWIATNATNTYNWRSVCWSPELELFVAVASSGTDRVMYSSDGVTWASASTSETSEWLSVCWSPELSIFVAVAEVGTNRVMYSNDGINWYFSYIELNSWISICWSSNLNKFVAVSYTGTNRVMRSL